MKLKTFGIPVNLQETIVGVVSKDISLSGKSMIYFGSEIDNNNISQFSAVVTSKKELCTNDRGIICVETMDHLVEGDIVSIGTSGLIHTLYRKNSHHNFLLATERCNSNCLMCSQPPKDKDDIKFLLDVHKKLLPLIPKDCIELGITGGEPTLMGNGFFELLELIKTNLPDTEVHCLTNGRTFAWKKMADTLAELNFDRLMLGIPLYSEHYQTHDFIVQARHAFDQTMKGLYNLASINQRIEIRIVLHKQSVARLVKLAKYIYKNLPFVEHVAFMGLEYQGYTPHNIDKLWIDPVEYMPDLCEATNYLSDHGMNVSVYNSQLCLMPKELWKFNKKSISDWKNIYLKECSRCSLSEECGGLFASCEQIHSKFIKPFINKLPLAT